MVLDKNVKITISGKDYNLCFPIRELFAAEKELSSQNLLTMLTTLANQATKLPAIGDLYVLFYHAVKGGKNGLDDDGIEDLWEDAIDELTLPIVAKSIYEAIGKPGIFGKKIQAAGLKA